MAQPMYRVVTARWVGKERVETDIGSSWKPLKAAKEELRALNLKAGSTLYSLQKKP